MPRNCSSICPVRIGDSPTSTPATKAPSTVCTPMLGDQRHRAHDHQDGGDHGKLADEIVVDPADEPEDQAPADGEAEGRKTAVPTTLSASELAHRRVPAPAMPKVMAMITQPTCPP